MQTCTALAFQSTQTLRVTLLFLPPPPLPSSSSRRVRSGELVLSSHSPGNGVRPQLGHRGSLPLRGSSRTKRGTLRLSSSSRQAPDALTYISLSQTGKERESESAREGEIERDAVGGEGGADRERERESARMIERRISKQMIAKLQRLSKTVRDGGTMRGGGGGEREKEKKLVDPIELSALASH